MDLTREIDTHNMYKHQPPDNSWTRLNQPFKSWRAGGFRPHNLKDAFEFTRIHLPPLNSFSPNPVDHIFCVEHSKR